MRQQQAVHSTPALTPSAPSRRPARQRLAGARDASTRRCTEPLAWKTSIFIVVTRQMCRLPLLLGEHLLHQKKSHLHLPCPRHQLPSSYLVSPAQRYVKQLSRSLCKQQFGHPPRSLRNPTQTTQAISLFLARTRTRTRMRTAHGAFKEKLVGSSSDYGLIFLFLVRLPTSLEPPTARTDDCILS